jgi:hypothetical protein
MGYLQLNRRYPRGCKGSRIGPFSPTKLEKNLFCRLTKSLPANPIKHSWKETHDNRRFKTLPKRAIVACSIAPSRGSVVGNACPKCLRTEPITILRFHEIERLSCLGSCSRTVGLFYGLERLLGQPPHGHGGEPSVTV